MWLLFATSSGDPFLDWFSQASGPAVLALAVIAFWRGWIVSGRELERVIRERDEFKELVHHQLTLANRVVDVSTERLAHEAALLSQLGERGRHGPA